jgi:hypothetical protein
MDGEWRSGFDVWAMDVCFGEWATELHNEKVRELRAALLIKFPNEELPGARPHLPTRDGARRNQRIMALKHRSGLHQKGVEPKDIFLSTVQ